MLETALRINFSRFHADHPDRLAAADYEPRICAIDVELELFQASKVANGYKASVMNKVSEIKKLSMQQDLHTALLPKPAAVGDVDDSCTTDKLPEEEEAHLTVSVEPISDFTIPNGAASGLEDLLRNVEPISDFPKICTNRSESNSPALAIDCDMEEAAANPDNTGSVSTHGPCTSTGDVSSHTGLAPERPKIVYFFERSSENEIASGDETGAAELASKKEPSSSAVRRIDGSR